MKDDTNREGTPVPDRKPPRFIIPRYAINRLSFGGVVIFVVAAVAILLSFTLAELTGETNPYIGIFIYMVLPVFLGLGFALILFGMFLTRRKIRKFGDGAIPRRPRIDLSRGAHRNTLILIVVGLVVFAGVSVVGSYQAFHHTESVSFCGSTCHTVMKPELVAYGNSSHARVACVKCHVGPGAGFYAKSKLSGAYQVYAVATNKYPRPIPTPIENLRPAQETCEQCHWPEKFFGAQQKLFNHFMYDEENSYWPINLLIKTGGGDPGQGLASGIHWHMNIEMEVEYIARDEKRQDIPWVRIKDRQTGRVTIYQNEEDPLTDEEIAAATPRTMDCMDCHNRPSHKYRSPSDALDFVLTTGQMDPSIPEIKLIAEEAMLADYETEDEAVEGIADYILTYYGDNYPDFYQENTDLLEDAVLAAQTQFKLNFFPEMKVRWDVYPDNIGHFIFPGCMRCHTINHRSDDGRQIKTDCSACHAIIAQGSGERAESGVSEEGLPFVHPEDIEEAWKEMACFECHEGTQP